MLLVVMLSSGAIGWLTYTPSGQIQKIQWQLSALLDDDSSGASSEMVADAAVAFAKNDQWDKAFAIVQQHLQGKDALDNAAAPKDRDLAAFIELTANVLIYATLTESKVTILKRLEEVTKSIQDNFFKSNALSATAKAYGAIGDMAPAQARLRDAINAADVIQDSRSKSEVLRVIAEAYGASLKWGQGDSIL